MESKRNITVDDAPSVLAAADLLAIDNDGLLGANDGERDDALQSIRISMNHFNFLVTYLDRGVQSNFFLIMLLIVVRIHPEVVECKLFLYPLLERCALLKRQRVALRNNRHHVDKLAQLLQHHNIDRLERVA